MTITEIKQVGRIHVNKKHKHHYFGKDEYVYYEKCELIDESGYLIPEPEFWVNRKDWSDSWKIDLDESYGIKTKFNKT